jgi:uncharacterized protein (DUF433 family)
MQERIVVDPQICAGKPCIRGTRIMVENILGMLAGGYVMDQILHAYLELSREDVVAAMKSLTQPRLDAVRATGRRRPATRTATAAQPSLPRRIWPAARRSSASRRLRPRSL